MNLRIVCLFLLFVVLVPSLAAQERLPVREYVAPEELISIDGATQFAQAIEIFNTANKRFRNKPIIYDGDSKDKIGINITHMHWFDAFELQRVDEHTETAGEVLVDIVRNPEVHVDHRRKRECPRCSGIKLKRHFFSARRKVEVDQCPNCSGYWLDHGELLAIRAERHAHAAKQKHTEGMPTEVIRYLYRLRTQATEQ